MHQLVSLIVGCVALLSLQDGGLAAKIPREDLINTLDNDIPINGVQSRPRLRRNFVDIEEAPAQARHTAGGITELSCAVMGSPTPHIQWLKNDMPIREEEPENNEVIDASQNSLAHVRSSLIIRTASPNKEDVYTCVAQAGLKTAEASAKVYNIPETESFANLMAMNRQLLAAPMKPKITEYIKTLIDDESSNILIRCLAKGNPTPDIYWHDSNNKLILNRDPRFRVLDSGELLISNVRWSDMGEYTCTAKNTFGKDSVSTFLYPVIKETTMKF